MKCYFCGLKCSTEVHKSLLCLPYPPNKIVAGTAHKCTSREIMALTGRFARRMLVWCSCGRGDIMDLTYISVCYKPPVLHTRCFPSWRAALLFLVKPLPVGKGLQSSASVDEQQNIRWPGHCICFSAFSARNTKTLRLCVFKWLQLSWSLFTK